MSPHTLHTKSQSLHTNSITLLPFTPPHTHLTHAYTAPQSVERPRGGQSVPAISPPTAVPTSTVVPKPTTAPSTATAAAAVENKTSSNVDLLGDLGGDPFGATRMCDV